MLALIFHSYRHQNSFVNTSMQFKNKIGQKLQKRKKAHLVTEHLKPQLPLPSKEESAPVTSPSSGQGAETESQTNVTPGTAGIQTTQHPGLIAYPALILAALGRWNAQSTQATPKIRLWGYITPGLPAALIHLHSKVRASPVTPAPLS